MVDQKDFQTGLAEIRELSKVAPRVTNVTVSVSRRLNTDNFEGEEFFQSQTIDFSEFWKAVDSRFPELDPGQMMEVQKLFAETAMYRIGSSFRSEFANVLCCVLERARAIRAPELHRIENDWTVLDTKEGFDPFNVRGAKNLAG